MIIQREKIQITAQIYEDQWNGKYSSGIVSLDGASIFKSGWRDSAEEARKSVIDWMENYRKIEKEIVNDE